MLDYTSFYFSKENPFLITYESSGTFSVRVEYFQREITYWTPGGRVTQPLRDCNGVGLGWVGNLPKGSDPAPTPTVGCEYSNVPQDYNFTIKDLGQGFN
jgi:hypothetical protein